MGGLIMKKEILVLVILGLFVLVACNNTQPPASPNTGTSPTNTGASDNSFAGTLADAMKLGKTFKCTMEVQGNTAEYYVKGNKFRSEATVQGVKAITIMDENKCLWIWQEGTTQGSKMCVSGESTQSQTSAPAQAQTKTDVKVSCNPAIVGDDMFTPQSNVKFTDLDEMMKQAQMPTIPGQ